RIGAEQRRISYLSTQAGLNQAKPNDFLELGELNLELNNIPQAVQALNEYKKFHPTDTRGLRDLAEAYRRGKQPQDSKAMTQLADALESPKKQHFAAHGRGE